MQHSKKYCMNINHPEMPEDIDEVRRGRGPPLRRRAPRPVRAALRQKARSGRQRHDRRRQRHLAAARQGPADRRRPDLPRRPTATASACWPAASPTSPTRRARSRLWATVAQGGVWESDRPRRQLALDRDGERPADPVDQRHRLDTGRRRRRHADRAHRRPRVLERLRGPRRLLDDRRRRARGTHAKGLPGRRARLPDRSRPDQPAASSTPPPAWASTAPTTPAAASTTSSCRPATAPATR